MVHCTGGVGCPIGVTLSLIGGKYKPLILWYLSKGTLRFTQLHKKVPQATARMLTQQLRELEQADVISRVVYPVVPPRVEYSLTAFGETLVPLLQSMSDWGEEYLRESRGTDVV